MTCRTPHWLAALAVAVSLTVSTDTLHGQSSAIEKLNVPDTLTRAQLDDYLTLIKPGPDESPWAKIPWHASVWEARKQAADEGKPILIWSGGGSPPIGAC